MLASGDPSGIFSRQGVVTMWGVTIRRESLSNVHPRFVKRYEVVRVYTVTVLFPVNAKKNMTSKPYKYSGVNGALYLLNIRGHPILKADSLRQEP